MSVLDLRQIQRAWHGASELRSIWLAGARIWRQSISIDALYGVGAGQVLLDLDPDQETGPITALQNRGGAGASYDAQAVGNVTAGGGLLDLDGASYLQTAAPFDLMGRRLFMPIRIQDAAVVYLTGANAGRAPGERTNLRVQNDREVVLAMRWDGGGWVVESGRAGTALAADTLVLLELQMQAAKIDLWINGRAFLSIDTVDTDFRADRLGGGQGRPGIDGALGRVIALTTDGSHTSQIELIRHSYRARYGLVFD